MASTCAASHLPVVVERPILSGINEEALHERSTEILSDDTRFQEIQDQCVQLSEQRRELDSVAGTLREQEVSLKAEGEHTKSL